MAQYRPRTKYMAPNRIPKLKKELFDFMIEGLFDWLNQFHSFWSNIKGFRRDLGVLFPWNGLTDNQRSLATDFVGSLRQMQDNFFDEGAQAHTDDQEELPGPPETEKRNADVPTLFGMFVVATSEPQQETRLLIPPQ